MCARGLEWTKKGNVCLVRKTEAGSVQDAGRRVVVVLYTEGSGRAARRAKGQASDWQVEMLSSKNGKRRGGKKQPD